jgi:hypothetical protein
MNPFGDKAFLHDHTGEQAFIHDSLRRTRSSAYIHTAEQIFLQKFALDQSLMHKFIKEITHICIDSYWR